MMNLLIIMVLSFIATDVHAISLQSLTDKLYAGNQELLVTKNKIKYSRFSVMAARSGFFPTLSFNNAASKGSNFNYSGSSVSDSISAPAGGASLPSGSGIQSVGSVNNENEGWSSDVSINVPIFTRFAVVSSFRTSKNNLKYDKLAHQDLKNIKRSQLVKLILELNMLESIERPIREAEEIISRVKRRSGLKKTKTLYNRKELLELETKYYELLYQKAKIKESLALARKAMRDLIPEFKEQWFKELPKLAISYKMPKDSELDSLYRLNSLSEKKDELEIRSTKEIYSATKWERAWVPMVVASGSYGKTGDFEGSPTNDSWRVSLGVTFELFDGFRSKSRRGQALHSSLMAQGKQRINRSKQVIILKHDKMVATVSRAEYMFKLARSKEKQHKYNQSKRISTSGATTSFEQSVLLLDYTMTKLEALDALKKYQSSILNIATRLNKLHEVRINEAH